MADEKRVFGRFRIEGELGRGANGVVLDAFDPQAGRRVALKLLRQGEQAAFESIERLRREAEALARIRHPNIVTVYESGARDGFHYVALEPVAGRPLSKVMKELGLPGRLDLVEQVARGLHAAHGAGVIHRDVKPSNVLVDTEGRARIIDFGLARLEGASIALTEEGALVGTPSYMAPEQARGRHELVGPWTDVYALGALLFEVLTGEVPHARARSLDELLELLDSDARAPLPSERASSVSGALDGVCARALEKDPKRRFQTAAAFADALRAARAAPSRAVRFPVVALAGLGLAAAAGLGGWAGVRVLESPGETGPPPPPPPTDPAAGGTRTYPSPDWYKLLAPKDRPPLPLPKGLAFGDRAGEYVNEKDRSLLLFVPGGTFLMGSADEDDRERPVHEVELSPFFIGKLETSVHQFQSFIAATHHATTAETRGSGRVLTVGGEMEAPGAWWRDPDGTGHTADDRWPVSQVSWFDARAYVEWAGLALPTEAQWEKAAAWNPKERKSRRYSWGDDLASASSPKVGNVLDETFKRRWPNVMAFEGYDDGYEKVAPVGSFPDGASFYGALDMTGNVSEWCLDRFEETFYSRCERKDPFCGEGVQVCVRGGCFSYGPRSCRARRRGAANPDACGENVGFRVALPLK